jgi:carbon starvation protein CstA
MNSEKLSDREYRNFGLVFAAMIALLFGFVLPWLFGSGRPNWPWIVGVPIVFLAFTLPGSLHYIYKPWMKFAHIAGFINTRIILAIIFFGLFTPIGIVLKMLRKDPLDKKLFEEHTETYWKESSNTNTGKMENMY